MSTGVPAISWPAPILPTELAVAAGLTPTAVSEFSGQVAPELAARPAG